MPDSDASSRPAPDPPPSCRNCGAPDPGRYCASCGQGTAHERLRLRSLLATALDHLLDLDVPILRTAIGLTLRPGVICREYVEGKRKPYANPLKYCFVTAAILVLTFTVLDISPSASVTGNAAASPASPASPASAAELVEALKGDGRRPSSEEVGRLFNEYFGTEGPRLIERNLNLVAFFAMPFVAFSLTLLFRRQKLTYAEHLVFVLFSYGHLLLFNALSSVVGGYANWQGMAVVTAFELAYLTWSGVVFYRARVITTLPRMLLVLLSYAVTSAILGGVLLLFQALYLFFLILSESA